MKNFKFEAVLRHDRGHTTITTWATTEQGAIDIIMAVEMCPRRSILSIMKVS